MQSPHHHPADRKLIEAAKDVLAEFAGPSASLGRLRAAVLAAQEQTAAPAPRTPENGQTVATPEAGFATTTRGN